MKRTRPAPVLLALAGLLLGACQSGRPEGGMSSGGFPAPAKEMVWDATVNALRTQGFAPDPEASSKQTWTIGTRWKTSMSPFSGMGTRDQATVRILDVPGRPGYYALDTQVIREVNNNMTEPSNPVVARWEKPERFAELEQIINDRVELFFLPGEASPTWRQRRNLPDATGTRIDPLELPTPPPAGDGR